MTASAVPVAPYADLLRAYRPGSSSMFSSPHRGAMLGEGVAAVVPGWTAQAAVAGAARALTADARDGGHPAPVLLGAIPFDEDLPPRLFIPARVRRAASLTAAAPVAVRAPVTPRAQPLVAPETFLRCVEQAIAQLGGDALRKVVLSRALELHGDEPIDVGVLLAGLAAREPNAYLFAIDLPRAIARPGDAFPVRPTRTLIGASPELLLRRVGRTVTTHPLAGSAPRSADTAEDRRRATALLRSAKDRREHAVVVEAITDILAPLCSHLTVPEHATLTHTSTMWHLGTPIRGELRSDATSLDVAMALHPTPAVCGTPTDLARATINALEPYRREFYCGLVGWMQSDGDGEWAVTIRCAEAEGATLRVYAGAGIMPDSDAGSELAETTAKLRTLLHAFGVCSPDGPS